MFITIEGISCAGKTTLCKALCKKITPSRYVTRSKEDTEVFLELRKIIPATGYDAIKLQYHFYPLIVSRLKTILGAQKNDEIVIADRDLWSFFVHGFATFQGSYSCYQEEFKTLFSKLSNESPYVSDLTVILHIPFSEWLKRAKKRELLPHPSLFSKCFYHKLQKAYQHVALILQKHALYIDGRLPTVKIVELIIRHMQDNNPLSQTEKKKILEVATSILSREKNEKI